MSLRIALKQFNAWVGDFDRNVKSMLAAYEEAAALNVDVLVFPELCVCGYPPEDLLLKRYFLEDNRKALEVIAQNCKSMIVLAGFAEWEAGKCYNSLAVIKDGRIDHVYRKSMLPNYGVFDEKRYFEPGDEPDIIDIGGTSVVLTICEDVWELGRFESLEKSEAQRLIINVSASPFHFGKIIERQNVLSDVARRFNSAIAYCNLVGGQDELVFDGRSMFVDPAGAVTAHAKAFEEDILVADIAMNSERCLEITNVKSAHEYPAIKSSAADVYDALILGTKDYVRKNGFNKVLIGLSGGIDSSLTAAIAVDAIGAENVVGVTMPTRFNTPETIRDAEQMAKTMGIEFHAIPIGEVLGKFDGSLNSISGWDNKTVAYENLQARIRGTILMSLSNCFGYLVVTTGNKSETAVGYSTLYGDTAGGFAIIKDVPKTLVYKLSRYVNERHGCEFIPQSVIDRPPSAELREDQKDSDSLPDYDLLDAIIKGYIEDDKSMQELCDESLPEDVVKRVIRLIDRNEYKRRQCPPGIKITPKAFGRDRRMPITNSFNPW